MFQEHWGMCQKTCDNFLVGKRTSSVRLRSSPYEREQYESVSSLSPMYPKPRYRFHHVGVGNKHRLNLYRKTFLSARFMDRTSNLDTSLCDIVASGARFGIIEGKTLPSSSVQLKLVSDYNFSGEKGVIVGREAEFRTRRNVSPSPA